MLNDGLTLQQLTTVAGLTIATSALTELFWRTINAPDATKTRFGPVSAVACGVVVAFVAGLLLGQGRLDLAQSVINGVFGGLAAMGVQNLVTSKVGIA